MGGPRTWLTLVGGLLTLLGLVATATLGAAPAAAHSDLVSSSPKDGAELPQAPDEVTLTFTDELIPGTVSVVAADDTDSAIPLDAPDLDGRTVTIEWPGRAPAGAYSVSYRVVSADGHPVTGTIRFSYAVPGSAATPSAAPSESATSDAPDTSASPDGSESAAATPSASAASSPPAAATATGGAAGSPVASTTTSGETSSPLPWILAALVVAGVAIAAAIAWVARRRADDRP